MYEHTFQATLYYYCCPTPLTLTLFSWSRMYVYLRFVPFWLEICGRLFVRTFPTYSTLLDMCVVVIVTDVHVVGAF